MKRLPNTKSAIERGARDFPLLLLFMAALIWQPVSEYALARSQWFREFTGVAPFAKVQIDRVSVDGLTMTVTGSFIKVRCQKLNITAWTQGADGILRSARLNTEPEGDVPSSRPASLDRTAFGPWEITTSWPDPVRARLYPVHICPDGKDGDNVPVSNLFFDLPWIDQP